jgi:hypothetical protein
VLASDPTRGFDRKDQLRGDLRRQRSGAPASALSQRRSQRDPWEDVAMTEIVREKCWTAGGAYSEVRWDPDTGCSEIRDYDSANELIARHEWELYPSLLARTGLGASFGRSIPPALGSQRVSSQRRARSRLFGPRLPLRRLSGHQAATPALIVESPEGAVLRTRAARGLCGVMSFVGQSMARGWGPVDELV